MRVRTAPALLIAALLVVGAVIVGVTAGQQARTADSADAGSSAVDNGAATGNDTTDGVAGSATPSPTASGTASPKAKSATGAPNSGKEGNPSGSTPTPYSLPGSKPLATPQPLIGTPLPPSASARGSIVKGFPAVIPQAPKSTVTFSSIATEGTRMQVGLDATTTISVADVFSYYRTAFEPLGLVAAATPAVDGSTALSFVRGDNGITVTVSDSTGGSRSHYTVTGVLSTRT
jgi:hypothetical protein